MLENNLLEQSQKLKFLEYVEKSGLISGHIHGTIEDEYDDFSQTRLKKTLNLNPRTEVM